MNRKVLFVFVLNFSVACLYSQENMEEAFKKTFRSELKMIEAKLTRKPQDAQLNYKYGLLCYRLCRYREARLALMKCFDTYKGNAYFFLDLYHVEMALKNKDQAQKYYYQYLTLHKNLPKNGDYVHRYQEVRTDAEAECISNNQNSLEYFPYVLNNDKIKSLTISKYNYSEPTSPLLFRNYLTEEVVYSDPDFKSNKIVKQPSKISDGFSYNAFCLNKNQDKIFMTRYDSKNKRMIICLSEREGINWGPFRTLEMIAKTPKNSFMHPMLTENEDQIIFTSDMAGGYGGYDLWIADLTESFDLKNVRNLGNKINTLGNECFPTLYSQSEIFFSSDGHPGYGSLDLYRVNISNFGITEPINLGASINSMRDEYGLFYSQDAQTAFYTSNRSYTNANLFIDKIYKIKVNVFNCELLNFEIKNPFAGDNYLASIPTENSGSNGEGNLQATTEAVGLPIENTSSNLAAQPENTTSQQEKVVKEETKTSNTLYEVKNDKIVEKFIRYEDKVIPTSANQTPNRIIENKFWTTAKLWFKDFDIAIGYAYIRVISPKNEVVYSNYSTENGLINIEVVESNEYTIEIPRFKTSLKGLVFKKGENNFYFPYVESDKLLVPAKSITSNQSSEPAKSETKKVNKLSTKKLSMAQPRVKSSKTSNHRNTSKSRKNDGEEKNAPRNMIEHFN